MSINLPLPLLGEMAVFVKVVETGSFSEAARQLGTSPSAVCRSISRLEKALATRLLQRTTRKLRLSDGGEEVFKRCQEMVSAAKSVMEISGQFTDEPEGLVRISVPESGRPDCDSSAYTAGVSAPLSQSGRGAVA